MKLALPFKTLMAGFALVVCSALPAQAGEWMVNYEKAMEKAKAENKPILVNFTGSDWCGWCIKMDEETFSKPGFQKFASEKLVLLEVDFPRNKEQSDKLKAQNEMLQKKYKVEGFPTFLLMNPNGKVIAKKVGYIPGGPKGLEEWAKEATKS